MLEKKHCAPYELFSLVVTGNSSWTTYAAIGYAYKTINGVWRLNFNITGSQSAASSQILTILGVVFKNRVNYYPAVTFDPGGAINAQGCHAIPNTSNISAQAGSNFTTPAFSGDLELERKPDWIQEN